MANSEVIPPNLDEPGDNALLQRVNRMIIQHNQQLTADLKDWVNDLMHGLVAQMNAMRAAPTAPANAAPADGSVMPTPAAPNPMFGNQTQPPAVFTVPTGQLRTNLGPAAPTHDVDTAPDQDEPRRPSLLDNPYVQMFAPMAIELVKDFAKTKFGMTTGQEFNPGKLSLAQMEQLWVERADEMAFIASKHMPDPILDLVPHENMKAFQKGVQVGQRRSQWHETGTDPGDAFEIIPAAQQGKQPTNGSTRTRPSPPASNGSTAVAKLAAGPSSAPASAVGTRSKFAEMAARG